MFAKLLSFVKDAFGTRPTENWYHLKKTLPNDVIRDAMAPFQQAGFRVRHSYNDGGEPLYDAIIFELPNNWIERVLAGIVPPASLA